jgi:hypothetical protein
MATTSNYTFTLPTVGANLDSWGTVLNNNWTLLDGILGGSTPITGIDINSGAIDGTPIGATTASTGVFTTVNGTTITASTGFTGALTGNASTATALQTARNFSITGDVTASDVSFDATGNVALSSAFNYNKIYPVGAIYISTSSTDPSTIFTGTSWSAFGAGRVLLGVGTENDGTEEKTFAGDDSGGKYNHTLTESEIPAHRHPSNIRIEGAGNVTVDSSLVTSVTSGRELDELSDTGTGSTDTGNTGGGSAHNNMQPYIAVYMWKRDS